MNYEQVKEKLGKLLGSSVILKKLFYTLLSVLLLRAWYIKKELQLFRKKNKTNNNISILDAGSGFGLYTYFIAKESPSWKIKGVDINTEEVDSCNTFFENAGLRNVSCTTADLVSFSSKLTYDLILSVDVMEHIEDDTTVFKNFYNSLKENGMLLISTPSDLGGSDVNHNSQSSFIEEHVRDGYSKDDITSKLKNAGFKIVDTYYTYGKYGSMAWRLSIKYPLIIGETKWFLPLLFIYYIIVMPFCLSLNYADIKANNKKGTGLIVKAYK